MINNYTEQEIAKFAETLNYDGLKISKWFEAESLPTPVIHTDGGKVVKEDIILKDLKGCYVGYRCGSVWLFDKDGNRVPGSLPGSHEKGVNQIIDDLANQKIKRSIHCPFNYDNLRITDLAWKLTPCKKPSKDFVTKCKISVVKDLIAYCEEQGLSFAHCYLQHYYD